MLTSKVALHFIVSLTFSDNFAIIYDEKLEFFKYDTSPNQWLNLIILLTVRVHELIKNVIF